MGTRAYVLISAQSDEVPRVVANLRTKEHVLMADAINGPHNAIAVIEGDTASSVAKAVFLEIRRLSGVHDVTVYLAEPEGPQGPASSA